MGAGWNLPVFGYWARLDDLDDKTIYPTVARVVESAGSVADAIKTFLLYNNWHRVGIMGKLKIQNPRFSFNRNVIFLSFQVTLYDVSLFGMLYIIA